MATDRNVEYHHLLWVAKFTKKWTIGRERITKNWEDMIQIHMNEMLYYLWRSWWVRNRLHQPWSQVFCMHSTCHLQIWIEWLQLQFLMKLMNSWSWRRYGTCSWPQCVHSNSTIFKFFRHAEYTHAHSVLWQWWSVNCWSINSHNIIAKHEIFEVYSSELFDECYQKSNTLRNTLLHYFWMWFLFELIDGERTQVELLTFAIVYATCPLNQWGFMLSGGAMLRMCGFLPFAALFKWSESKKL